MTLLNNIIPFVKRNLDRYRSRYLSNALICDFPNGTDLQNHFPSLCAPLTATPRKYFEVYNSELGTTPPAQQTAIIWNIGRWKRPAITYSLTTQDCFFVKSRNNAGPGILDQFPDTTSPQFIWGYTENAKLAGYFQKNNVKINRIEDGFIRSAALGTTLSEPLSLAFDNDTLYFDARKPSRLENLLNQFDEAANRPLLKSTEIVLELYKKLKISKYNQNDISYRSILPIKTKQKRILVLGQVEDDASIRFGNAAEWNNEKLLSLASTENPDAQIIYKPHPDVLKGYRIGKLKKLGEKYLILTDMVILADLFKEIDHVYTLTSLSGLEALLNDCTVTTVGSPFYSGWGACDDRQSLSRRTNKLSRQALFHVAYIAYPKYLLNIGNALNGCIATLLRITAERRVNTFLQISKNDLKENGPKLANSNYWPLLIKFKSLCAISILEMALSNEKNAIQTQNGTVPDIYQFFLDSINDSIQGKRPNASAKMTIEAATHAVHANEMSPAKIAIKDALSQDPTNADWIKLLIFIACQQQDWQSANLLLRYHNCVAPLIDSGESELLQAVSEGLTLNFGESLTCASLACSQSPELISHFAKLVPFFEKELGVIPYLSSMRDAWRITDKEANQPLEPKSSLFQEIYSLLVKAAHPHLKTENHR